MLNLLTDSTFSFQLFILFKLPTFASSSLIFFSFFFKKDWVTFTKFLKMIFGKMNKIPYCMYHHTELLNIGRG